MPRSWKKMHLLLLTVFFLVHQTNGWDVNNKRRGNSSMGVGGGILGLEFGVRVNVRVRVRVRVRRVC